MSNRAPVLSGDCQIMSRILESALDPARKAEADANDTLHAFGRGPSGAHYDENGCYRWPFPWRSDAPSRRRDEPRASRWGDL